MQLAQVPQGKNKCKQHDLITQNEHEIHVGFSGRGSKMSMRCCGLNDCVCWYGRWLRLYLYALSGGADETRAITRRERRPMHRNADQAQVYASVYVSAWWWIERTNPPLLERAGEKEKRRIPTQMHDAQARAIGVDQ